MYLPKGWVMDINVVKALAKEDKLKVDLCL